MTSKTIPTEERVSDEELAAVLEAIAETGTHPVGGRDATVLMLAAIELLELRSQPTREAMADDIEERPPARYNGHSAEDLRYAIERNHYHTLANAVPALLARIDDLENALWCLNMAAKEGNAEIGAGLLACDPSMPRYLDIGCSQCGKKFGPGDHGFSDCIDHDHLKGNDR
ncbi:MAG: hypothetical protein WC829_18185 [Hyphomicrobium sp.]|jgi:hypothetical protein